MRFTRLRMTASAIALLAVAHTPAFADRLANLDGSCPSDMTPYVKHGKNQCKSAPKKESSKPATTKSAKSSSSSGGTYQDPVLATVAKANKFGFCPSGYYTNEDACTTSWADAPKSLPKSGACPSGTVEEHGAFCTAVIADTSNEVLDRVDGFATRDFNVVYTAALVAAAKPAEQKRGEAFVQAIAKRQAAGNPWQSRHARDAAKAAIKTPEQLAYEKQQSEQEAHRANEFAKMCAQIRQAYGGALPGDHECAKAPAPTATALGAPGLLGQAANVAQNPQEAVKEAAKQEVGNALRGLFGR